MIKLPKKTKTDKVLIQTRISPELFLWIKGCADANELTMAAWVRQTLKLFWDENTGKVPGAYGRSEKK